MEKEFVEYIAKSIVDDPSGVQVTEVSGDKTLVLELRVADDDLGKVIGKGGNIAEAIRTLLYAIPMKNKKRITFYIIDN